MLTIKNIGEKFIKIFSKNFALQTRDFCARSYQQVHKLQYGFWCKKMLWVERVKNKKDTFLQSLS